MPALELPRPSPPVRSDLRLRTCLFALLVACACEGKPESGARAGAPATLAIGAPAPDYGGRTLQGEPLALSDLRGKVVLLNVWATWCEPCLEEMPDLKAMHERLQARGFTVLGVSIDAARDAGVVRTTVADWALPFPVIHDARNAISGPYRVAGYPTSFLLDRSGALRWRKDGLLAPDDPALVAAIEAALAEPPP